MTIEETLELIPSQHRYHPRFRAWCSLMMEPFQQAIDLCLAMPSHFDIDTAVGKQLDTLGLWIGRSRFVQVPLTDFFFTWDTTPEEGWDASNWVGEFESQDFRVTLSDEDYRKLLKAKISANNWNGDRAGQYRTLEAAFGATKAASILIRDNQDMTMSVLYNAGVLTATEAALLTKEYILIRPCGVGINFEKYYLAPFEFDAFRGGSPLLDGEIFGAGVWGEQITLNANDWIVAKAWIPFSEETVITAKLAGVEFATITFPAGGVAPVLGTAVMTGDTTVVEAIDLVQFEGPAVAPAAGGAVSLSVLGYRAPTF